MAYDLKDFADIVNMVMGELKHDPNDVAERNRIKRDVNAVYLEEVVPFKRWKWLYGNVNIKHNPYFNDGTVSVKPNDTTITFSQPPAESKKGHYFAVDNFNEIYIIEEHEAGSPTAILSTPYTGFLNPEAPFKIWTNKINLPLDCRETIEVWHDFSVVPMEPLGLQEFRKRSAAAPKQQGRPVYYTTYDYEGETEEDRQRIMLIYPAIDQYSTTLHVDYVREAEPLVLDGDEPLMPREDRIVLVYGALERAWRRARNPEEAQNNRLLFERKLALMAGRVEDSNDKPQITPDSRYIYQKRGRGRSTLNRFVPMSGGGGSYTPPTYVKNATIEGANVTANVTVSPGVTIDGRDISADGAALDSHLAATSSAHPASAITVTPSGNLSAINVQAALEELQAGVDSSAPSSALSAHINAETDAHAASAISVTPTGNLSATDVQTALDELQSDIDTRALESDLTAHVTDTTGAHAASAISVTPTGNLSSTDTQSALQELQADIDAINASKAQPNGIATLDSSGKVPSSQIPAIAISEVHSVADIVERDQLEAQSGDIAIVADSDGSGTPGTFVYDGNDWLLLQSDASLTAHAASTSTHGVTEIVGASEQQTLTNKDIDGGTASDTNRITLPKNTKANLDSLTRKEGTIVYSTDTKKAYIDDGVLLRPIGSGDGSGINYITDGDAEGGVIGTLYNDSAAIPVDGTGGTVSGVTWELSEDSPLRGTKSFVLSKDASNCQGIGVAIDFEIDRADLHSVLEIGAEYLPSGTYVDGDVQFWIIGDPDGVKAVRQPVGYRLLNVLVPSKLTGVTFQNEGWSKIRLCIHIASTSANAYSIKFDSLSVGPQIKNTAVLRGPVGSIIYTGSLIPPTGYLYCDGRAVSRTQYAKLFAAIGTTFGAGDGSTTFNLPDLRGIFIRGAGSQTISGITYSGTLGQKQTDQMQRHKHNDSGHVHRVDLFQVVEMEHSRPHFANARAGGSTMTSVGYANLGDPVDSGTGGGTPRIGSETRPANIALAAHICYDDGNVVLSSETSNRPIAGRYRMPGPQAFGPEAIEPLNFSSVISETYPMVQGSGTSTKFIIPESGWYHINAAIYISAEGSPTYVNAFPTLLYAVNGSQVVLDGIGNESTNRWRRFNGGDVRYLKAGDVVDFRFNRSSGEGAVTVADGYASIIKINSGSQQIAASEKIHIHATTTSGQSIGTSQTDIVFDTVVRATHPGAYNPTTGVFTAPRAGEYTISYHIQTEQMDLSTTERVLVRLITDDSNYVVGRTNGNGAHAYYAVNGSITIYLQAGQTAKLVGNSGVDTTLNTTANVNWLTIYGP